MKINCLQYWIFTILELYNMIGEYNLTINILLKLYKEYDQDIKLREYILR